jgi:hypothetical protein
MKFLKSLFVAALLLAPSFAFAQTYWSPTTGFYQRDGGNDPPPIFPLAIGNHGVASINGGYNPLVTTFGATWGTVNNSATLGSDSDFSINFYSGTGAATTIGATIFTINFGQAWGSATGAFADGGTVPLFGGFCYFLGPYASTGPTLGSLFPLVEASTSTATVVTNAVYTPANTTNFHFGCHVFNLGSPY